MLTLNSQNLMNTVNFMNNSLFYLTSMSHYNYSLNINAHNYIHACIIRMSQSTLLLTIHTWYSSNLFSLPTLIGYYNGVPTDINEVSVNTGGQCEEGIKLILLIGDVPLPALDSETPGPAGECLHA